MKFEHRFRVNAPQATVAEFHTSARALKAITPPPIFMQVHSAPEPLTSGDHVIFTMWLGPLPLKWDSRIEEVSITGFTDYLDAGVFNTWKHRHNFVTINDNETEVYDVIEATLKPHIFFGPLGLLMWLGNPVLFAYRAWKTKRLLQK